MSMGNVNPQMFAQAQSVQRRLVKLREEMKERVVEASSGGGLVTAYANGNGELVKLSLKKEAVDPSDVGMLEDLIVAAVQKSQDEAQRLQQGEMAKITGGLHVPGLF